MNESNPYRHRSIPALSTLAALMAGGCSGQYPLGSTHQSERLLESGEPTANTKLVDAQLPSVLAAPDFTIAHVDPAGPGLVASVGDLDGDGRDEMAIGSADFSTRVAFVQLRYGRPRPQSDTEAFGYGQDGPRLAIREDAFLTPSVSKAGDVDNDGYDDFVVIATECTSPPDRGRGVYLVYGGPERLAGTLPMESVAVHFLPPEPGITPDDNVACNIALPVAAPGDIDGDGIDDLVLGVAPYTNYEGDVLTGTGEGLYVFYGRTERFSGEVPYTAADATLAVDQQVTPYAIGDVNGDGLRDMFVGLDYWWFDVANAPLFFLPGRGSRFAGTVDLATVGMLLEGAQLPNDFTNVYIPTDLDGDGLSDVLLDDDDRTDRRKYLFYGATGLFADGIDLALADAVSPPDTGGLVHAIGDMDADGDDELIDTFGTGGGFSGLGQDVALTSGSRERLSGTFSFPEGEVLAQHPNGPYPDVQNRLLDFAIPAGDLDGDGAADLMTLSRSYEPIDESSYQTYDPQLHVHYGRPSTQSEIR